MVAGHYQPLADDGSRAALRPSDQTCPLQSGQKTKRRGLKENPLVFAPSIKRANPRTTTNGVAARGIQLLNFNLRASVFQLLLRRFRVGLVDAFLDRLRGAVD